MNFPLTIVYNMQDRKVGCVLLQPSLGGFIPLIASIQILRAGDVGTRSI
jgi:hypothetical protein